MKDFDEYQEQLETVTKNFKPTDALFERLCPKQPLMHSMICEYSELKITQDNELWEQVESLDYFEYERELWNLSKTKQ